jgi:hypothetical protein
MNTSIITRDSRYQRPKVHGKRKGDLVLHHQFGRCLYSLQLALLSTMSGALLHSHSVAGGLYVSKK